MKSLKEIRLRTRRMPNSWKCAGLKPLITLPLTRKCKAPFYEMVWRFKNWRGTRVNSFDSVLKVLNFALNLLCKKKMAAHSKLNLKKKILKVYTEDWESLTRVWEREITFSLQTILLQNTLINKFPLKTIVIITFKFYNMPLIHAFFKA